MKGNEMAVCGFSTSKEAGSRHSMFKFTITEKKMKATKQQIGVTPIFLKLPVLAHVFQEPSRPQVPSGFGEKSRTPWVGDNEEVQNRSLTLVFSFLPPKPCRVIECRITKASSPSFAQFISVPSLNKRLMITFLHYTERGISIVTTHLHLLRIIKQTNKGKISLK